MESKYKELSVVDCDEYISRQYRRVIRKLSYISVGRPLGTCCVKRKMPRRQRMSIMSRLRFRMAK